jgi:hypothetical protein
VRTTVTIEDRLFDRASQAAGEDNASAVIRKSLELLVSMESRKRLLMLSGKAPDFTVPERKCRVADPVSDYPAQNPEPAPDPRA